MQQLCRIGLSICDKMALFPPLLLQMPYHRHVIASHGGDEQDGPAKILGDEMLRYFSGKLKIAAMATAILSAAVVSPVAAQTDPAPAIQIHGGVELVSDYRFRGISLSGGDIAIQPSITAEHHSGVYAGLWASNIENQPASGKAEVDIFAGYATEIASGTVLDVGLAYYWYPEGDKAAGASDFFEISSKLSHTLGPLEATGTIAYSWDQAALGDDNLYLGLGLAAGVPYTPLTLQAGVGYSDGALADLAPHGHYWDWSVGASAVFGSVTAGVKYVDTNIPHIGIKSVDKYYKARLIFSLGTHF